MKCIDCFKKEADASHKNTNVTYLRSNISKTIAPICHKRIYICQKCGARKVSLETLINKPIIKIDDIEYNKTKHLMSILKAMKSTRQEAHNVGNAIIEQFLSECYSKYYDFENTNKNQNKIISISKEELITFTYEHLKDSIKKHIFGATSNYDEKYLNHHKINKEVC